MDTLLNIIVNPVKAFNQLKTEVKFPFIALIILLMLILIHLILMMPISAKLGESVISSMSQLSEKQMDMALQVAHKLRYLSILSGFIMYIIILFACSLLLFVIAQIFKTQLTYSKALRLMIYCFVITAIGDIVNVALIYFKGIDNLTGVYDVARTGINLLTSVDNAGAPFYVFLSSINPFQIWFVILLALGVKIFTDSTWAKAWTICIIYWLIVILIPVASAYFSQIVMANKGIHI